MGRTLTKNVRESMEAGIRPVRLCVVGADGRFGSSIVRHAASHGCEVTRPIGRGEEPATTRESPFDVVVDVSTVEGVHRACKSAEAHEMPLLECVTSLDASAESALKVLESRIPVLVTSNTSLGIAMVRTLLGGMSSALEGWSVSISETHHAGKVDRPSGTARTIVHDLRTAGRAIDESDVVSHREGEVVGTHEIVFADEQERIVIRHEALDRSIFAMGALRAARWLAAGRRAGRYAIADTLEGSDPSSTVSD